MITPEEEARKALLLLASIKMELEKGTLHYNQSAQLLKIPEEILDDMKKDGKVTVVQKQ